MGNRKARRAAAREMAKGQREVTARIAKVKRQTLPAAGTEAESRAHVTLGPKGPPSQTDWMPLPALAGIALTGLIAYFVAEASLSGRLHPLHWVAAVAGGSLGYVGGLVLHRLRGY